MKKFIEVISIEDYEIETDDGWKNKEKSSQSPSLHKQAVRQHPYPSSRSAR